MTINNQGFPQITAPVVDNRGMITQTWYKLMLSLWQRSGAGTGESTSYVPSNVAITGGSIDGTVIGSSTPTAGTFTTLRVLTQLLASNFSGSSRGTNTGDVTLTGEGYLSISGQSITASKISQSNIENGTANRLAAYSGTGAFSEASIGNGLSLSGGVLSNSYKSSDGSNGLTVTITTAALTTLGSQGSMTFKNGLLTAQTQAT